MATDATSTKKPIYDFAAKTVTWNIPNFTPIVLHMEKVHADNINRAAYVGFGQVRVKDAAAIGVADSKGNIIPESERNKLKHARMLAIVEHLESGSDQWNLPRAGAVVRVKVDQSVLIRQALLRCNVKQEKIDALTADKLERLAKSRDVALAMLAIQNEQIASTIDPDAELAELMGDADVKPE